MQSRSHIAVFISLFLTLVIDNMGVGLIFPVLSPLFVSIHGGMLPTNASVELRDLFYSLTLGLFGVGMFIGAPILGDLSDQLGRKKVLLLCLICTSIAFALSAISISIHNVWLLLIARIFGGLMAGSMPIAQAAIIDISTPENKIKNISLITFALCFGFAVGPMVGGYFSNQTLFPWFNYATPFYAAAILAAFNATCLLFTFRETFTPPALIKLNLTKGMNLFFDAFRHQKIRLLTIMILLQQLGWALYFQFVSLFLAQVYHYDSTHLGHFMSFVALWFGTALLIIVRIFLRFFDEEILTTGCLIIIAAGLFGLVLFDSSTMQWILCIPIATALAMSYTASLTLLSNLVSRDEQGWIMGIATSVMAAAWGITGFLTGPLAILGAHVPFIVAALLMVGSVICMVIYLKKHRVQNLVNVV